MSRAMLPCSTPASAAWPPCSLIAPSRTASIRASTTCRLRCRLGCNAWCGEIRPHHALHPNRQRNRQVVEALIDAVRDGAISEQGGQAALAGVEQGSMALDIQVGFLLPGKAGVRQILGRGTAADGDIHGIRMAVSA